MREEEANDWGKQMMAGNKCAGKARGGAEAHLVRGGIKCEWFRSVLEVVSK